MSGLVVGGVDLADIVPILTLPDGQKIRLTSDEYHPHHVSNWPPALQRKIVRMLEELLQQGHVLPRGNNDKEQKLRRDFICKVSWYLAQTLRYSQPTRIVEAVPPLTFLAETYKQKNGSKSVDLVPTLYLSVALSRFEGEEERSIRAFKEGSNNIFSNGPFEVPALNLIWARANHARLLRRMNRTAEAEKQERLSREWILGHRYKFAPSEIHASIADDIGTGGNIVDHPDVMDVFRDIEELGPGVMLMGGNLIYNPKV